MAKNKKTSRAATPPAPPPPDAPEAPSLSAAQRAIVWLSMAVAAGVGAYLFFGFMKATYSTEAFESACNFGPRFNCDKINTSVWGKIAGVPITVFAVPTYAVFAVLAAFAGGTGSRARAALKALLVGSGAAVAYGLFLFYVMAAIEQTFCVFCLTMDLGSLVTFVVALLAFRARGPGADDWRAALVPSVVVLLALSGAGLGVHGLIKSNMLAELNAAVDADVDTAAPAAVPAPASDAESDVARKIDDKNYFIPIFDDDASLGPKDAKVTVVEFADFQCGYCKKLFYSLSPVKKKYKDEVRFVFKHFPMNTKCNDTIKNNRHRYACDSSVAAECARVQGRFWPMHDLLFKNQHKLKPEDLDYYASEVGLDMNSFKQCLRDPKALTHIKRDIKTASQIEITGTPRTYINGRFFRGALPQATLEHVIEQELGRREAGEKPQPVAQTRPTLVPAKTAPAQVEIKLPEQVFWIDSFEGSLDQAGHALSLEGVLPANATWYEAKAACESAGKRLCSTEEWVSACQGEQAVDDDGDGNFANDYVEGNQFPYADWYEARWCRDTEDRDTGKPGPAGSMPRCQTPTGIFDLGGNVAEWAGLTEGEAVLLGGDYRAKDKTGCFRPASTFGPGHKNIAIGFRCCSDAAVANRSAQAVDAVAPASMDSEKLPAFEGDLLAGGTWSTDQARGKVVYVTFFASWCGPCRKELPALKALRAKYADRGFEVVSIGVDAGSDGAQKSAAMAKQLGIDYPVILDPQNKILGLFDVKSMPTSYLVDRGGIIRHKQVGFGTTTIETITPHIEAAL